MSNTGDAHRIADLENLVKFLKQVVITVLDKVKKSAGLEATISSLEEKASTLSSRITELTDNGQYMTNLLERASEQLSVSSSEPPSIFHQSIH
jgi:hypothetical protein